MPSERQGLSLILFFKLTWPILFVIGFAATFDLSFDFVGLSFLLVVLQSALFLGYSAARPATLFLMYWIFGFSFLGLIPWLHYSEGVTIWRAFPPETTTYVSTNTAVFFANLGTFVTYQYAIRKRGTRAAHSRFIRRPQLTAFLLLVFSVLGFLGVLYNNNFDFRLLFFRGLFDQSRDVVFTSSALALVFGMLSRMTPAFAFYFSVTELERQLYLKIILFGLLVLAVFPTGVARYFVAYTYIPVLMIMVPAMRRGAIFALVFLLALLFVFPFLDQFRYFAGFDQIRILPSGQFFFAAHFDAYENFASAVEAHFITDGYQLLGALLFFVPRVVWSDKPVGSGYEMAETMGYVFNNISMPFLGEGYVNFGFVGVIVFSLIIGYLMGRGDRVLAPAPGAGRKLNYRNTIYYFLFGGLFFVFRGDLLSSFAYLAASLIVALFIGGSLRLLNSRLRT